MAHWYRVNDHNVGWQFDSDVGYPTHLTTIMKTGTPKYIVASTSSMNLYRLPDMTGAIVWTILAVTPVIQITVDRRTIAVITGSIIYDDLVHTISSIITTLGVPYGLAFNFPKIPLRYTHWIIDEIPKE
jgi:hypothetical protein